MSRRRLKILVPVLAALAPLLAVLPATGIAASGPKVGIKGDEVGKYKFSPTRLEVRAGTTVRWGWDSNSPHNVVFDRGRGSKTGNSGSYRKKFAKPGTFEYICTIHEFTGKVVVADR